VRQRILRGLAAATICLAGAGLAGCRPPGPPPAPGPNPIVAAAIHAAFGDLGPGTESCFVAIAGRESGFDPGARNGSGASGLFQIMLPLHDDLFYALGVQPDWWHWASPDWNAQVARELYNSSGISPWGRC
jgi:Transglycosylase SLT domain